MTDHTPGLLAAARAGLALREAVMDDWVNAECFPVEVQERLKAHNGRMFEALEAYSRSAPGVNAAIAKAEGRGE